jgi:hypothetical protein
MTTRSVKTIIVSGASSAAGKTTLAEAVIQALSGGRWGGIKITVTHDIVHGCPRGGSGCGVCASVPSGYRIITEPEIITQPRTDTGRFVEAGADPVLWAITTPPFVRQAWDDLTRRLVNADGAVIESNSLAVCLRPDLNFLTINPRVPRSRWKASAPTLIESSDFVIISLHDAQPERAHDVIEEIRAKRNGRGVIITDAVEHALDFPHVRERLNDFQRASELPV